MISVVIPCHYRNAGLLSSEEGVGSLHAMLHKSKSNPPDEVVVVAEGGSDSDWAHIPGSVDIVRRHKITDYQSAAHLGLDKVTRGKFVFVVAPWVVIEDPNWIGKLQNVILKSPSACIVSAVQSKSNTSPPHRVINPFTTLGLDLFATTRTALKDYLPEEEGATALDVWQAKAVQAGCTRWEHPGIRHFTVSHPTHEKTRPIVF